MKRRSPVFHATKENTIAPRRSSFVFIASTLSAKAVLDFNGCCSADRAEANLGGETSIKKILSIRHGHNTLMSLIAQELFDEMNERFHGFGGRMPKFRAWVLDAVPGKKMSGGDRPSAHSTGRFCERNRNWT